MVGTWQDSSHFSSLNPPSFLKKKKKVLVFPYFYFIVPSSSLSWLRHMHTVSLFSFHCVSQIFTHLHGHLFLERALSWFPCYTAPPTLFPTMHTRWVLLVNTGGENCESGQKAEEWAWAASSADMISSWLGHWFWALGVYNVHRGCRVHRHEGLSM